jgi:adenylyltransferase/sulfurtransferase
MLTPKERIRYDRQMMVDGFGDRGQERFKSAKVLVAGIGGLGSPVCFYLTAAGIGTLRLIDCDQVELSNLNRQILHGTPDIGQNKVDSAEKKLKKLNPEINLEAVCETITSDNVMELSVGFDLIVDAMDNLATRFLLNRAAIAHRIPFFHGAVSGMEGRVMTIIPGESACLRCLYRAPIKPEKFPVVGVTPAVVGSIQAAEVLKFLAKTGRLLTNRMLVYDGLNSVFTEFKLQKNSACDHCGSSQVSVA